jgi:hypothetical protein
MLFDMINCRRPSGNARRGTERNGRTKRKQYNIHFHFQFNKCAGVSLHYLWFSINSFKMISKSSLAMGRPGEGVGVESPSVDVDVSNDSSSASSMLRSRAPRADKYKLVRSYIFSFFRKFWMTLSAILWSDSMSNNNWNISL